MLWPWGANTGSIVMPLNKIGHTGRGAHQTGETKNLDSDMAQLRRLLNNWVCESGVQGSGLRWGHKCE